jgi:hypothetical protein
MQIKRLLDDREVCFGMRMFDAQGRPYALVRHSYERYVKPSSAATLRESPLK